VIDSRWLFSSKCNDLIHVTGKYYDPGCRFALTLSHKDLSDLANICLTYIQKNGDDILEQNWKMICLAAKKTKEEVLCSARKIKLKKIPCIIDSDLLSEEEHKLRGRRIFLAAQDGLMFPDVEIVCSDGNIVYAHKAVLAVAADFPSSSLTSDADAVFMPFSKV
jgi:hypothetical protein